MVYVGKRNIEIEMLGSILSLLVMVIHVELLVCAASSQQPAATKGMRHAKSACINSLYLNQQLLIWTHVARGLQSRLQKGEGTADRDRDRDTPNAASGRNKKRLEF
ncbi:hypothetical protein VNO78_03496 [Psophocarpus tetragonolobus]|uniref:Uncharacterized protein n=1 Tax=Psophocarpus tetragonolobus TaxID=3891 RepID=A0AAN9XVM6_PSOTE